MNKVFLYSILFIALFGGLFYSFGLPEKFSVATELLIYFFFIYALISRKSEYNFIPHLWYAFLYLIMIAACSMVLNELSVLQSIFSLRLLLRFYFFYLAIIALDMNDDVLKRVITIAAVFIILQLPVVFVKFLIYGIDERTQGAYAVHDGSMTTMLPIVVLFFLSSYYFLYKPKLLYIIIAIGFIFFSIVGKKRAVFYLYPIQFLAIYLYIYVKAKKVQLTKKLVTFIALAGVVITISSSILFFNETLNPEGEVGGEVDPTYALSFAQKYTTGVDGYGYSYGRVETSRRIFKHLTSSDFVTFFFGHGPGSTTISLFQTAAEKRQVTQIFDDLKIGYGLTTIGKIALEYGLLGVIAFTYILSMLAKMCWAYYQQEHTPYWKAFAGGAVGFAFAAIFFTYVYHWTAFWGDTFPALYFFAVAIVYTKYRRLQMSVKVSSEISLDSSLATSN